MLTDAYLHLPSGFDGARLLSRPDVPTILDLLTRCSDYLLLQDGEPATAADADELFTDMPPPKHPDDQHVTGCFGGIGSMCSRSF